VRRHSDDDSSGAARIEGMDDKARTAAP
jgi:hypothetical protein